MIYIEPKGTSAARHFAAEEYIMENIDGNVMMIWQADNCIMLGSNQVANIEADLHFAHKAGINIVRRPSGGGAIFTDMGTLLYTFITPYEEADIARNKAATAVAEALKALGVPADVKGRNDIICNGKKISGLAQYIKYGKICTHGSLLYNADLDKLAAALTPDEGKIITKGIRSVRSRVTNIAEYMEEPPNTEDFWHKLKNALLKGQNNKEYVLNEEEYAAIDKICEAKYNNNDWTYGRAPKFTFHNTRRYEEGRIEIFVDVEKGLVKSCAIRGDFLAVRPISELEARLSGVLFLKEDFSEVLNEVKLADYLGNIKIDEFLSAVFE